MADQTPLSPVQIEQLIYQLQSDLDRGVWVVKDAEEEMVEAKRHYDREVAQATLEAKGTVQEKQARVELSTQAAREEYEIAQLAFRHAERMHRTLRDRVSAAQSQSASVRQSYSAAGR